MDCMQNRETRRREGPDDERSKIPDHVHRVQGGVLEWTGPHRPRHVLEDRPHCRVSRAKIPKSKSGYKWNHFDVGTGDRYWISGPRKDGRDRLYAQSSQAVEIDDDIREEYWTKIRGRPAGR
jgi:hypothetical protein